MAMPDQTESSEQLVHVPVSDREIRDIIEASYGTRPRRAETCQSFDRLVAEVFVPFLRAEGFNKRNLTWYRKRSRVWPLVQVCKARADGDFLEFWVEWGLHVTGYQSWSSGTAKEILSPIYSPLRGDNGDLDADHISRHWMVALGRVGEYVPTQVFRDVAPDIKRFLKILVPYLDQFETIESILSVLRMDNGVEGSHLPAALSSWHRQQAIATLEDMARSESVCDVGYPCRGLQ